jgi:hypothetical protein
MSSVVQLDGEKPPQRIERLSLIDTPTRELVEQHRLGSFVAGEPAAQLARVSSAATCDELVEKYDRRAMDEFTVHLGAVSP